MAFELGKDWRFYVGNGSTPTEVFTAIGGEGSFEMSRASDEIDLSTKDDGTYKFNTFGLQAVSFNVSGKLKLPDTALQRIDTIAKSGNPVLNIQIKKGSTIKFHGQVGIGNFSATFNNGDVATYSFNAVMTDTPTVDNIAA